MTTQPSHFVLPSGREYIAFLPARHADFPATSVKGTIFAKEAEYNSSPCAPILQDWVSYDRETWRVCRTRATSECSCRVYDHPEPGSVNDPNGRARVG